MWRRKILFENEGGGGGGGGGNEGGGGGNEGGGNATSWRDGLPDGLKAHAGLGKFKDIPSLAEGYINAEKMIGADKIVLPGKDAKPEDWEPIFDKLGRPKTADEYVIPEVKDRPFTAEDKALQGKFKPVAHKLGLSPAQVAGLAEWQTGLAMEGIAAQTKAAGDAEAALRKEYPGEKYDAFMEKANTALEMVLTKAKVPLDTFKQIKLADGTFLGDNALMVKLYGAIGDAMGETGFEGGGGGGAGDPFSSPAAAQAELDKLKNGDFKGLKHPYRNKRDGQHKAWQERVMKLQALASSAPKK